MSEKGRARSGGCFGVECHHERERERGENFAKGVGCQPHTTRAMQQYSARCCHLLGSQIFINVLLH
jgi:hypothetical protein